MHVTGVIDTGEAPEKSNISANIRKKSKSLLGLFTGARRRCLKKKNRGEKSGGTVPLNTMVVISFLIKTVFIAEKKV
jgi:hypothetical protein